MNPLATEQVSSVVAGLGIPQNAVDVSRTKPPVVSWDSVTQYKRGALGGTWIDHEKTSGFGFCTLGYNVHMPGNGEEPYFMTAAHCSKLQGVTEGTAFWQKDHNDSSHYIGVEVWDEHFFYGNYYGNYCPPSRACRYTDAMVGHYESPGYPAFGYLPYPSNGWNDGTLAYYTCGGCFKYIVSEGVWTYSGQIVAKWGVTTGATAAQIQGWGSSGTCVTVEPAGRLDTAGIQIQLQCQSVAEGTNDNQWVAGPGDSGGPVISTIENEAYQVEAVGILWGSNCPSAEVLEDCVESEEGNLNTFTFSAMGFLKAEYGNFSTY